MGTPQGLYNCTALLGTPETVVHKKERRARVVQMPRGGQNTKGQNAQKFPVDANPGDTEGPPTESSEI